MKERIRELMSRAGLGPLPTSVLVGITFVCLVAAVAGFARWGSAADRGSRTAHAAIEAPVQEDTVATSIVTSPADEVEEVEPVVLWVHIVGAVFEPGVYAVPDGARLNDALDLAGGLTGNAAARSVNLARRVVDGEQVYVATTDEWERSAAGSEPGSNGHGLVSSTEAEVAPGPLEPIDVNRADTAALETLPGIGPATAAKIVADRTANGPFDSVDDLVRVPGIGEAKLEALRGLVTVR